MKRLSCSVLQCVAVCCSVLQYVTAFCKNWNHLFGAHLPQRTCAHEAMLQCVAVCCSVLQCAAVCCSVLQCVAVCCTVLQKTKPTLQRTHLKVPLHLKVVLFSERFLLFYGSLTIWNFMHTYLCVCTYPFAYICMCVCTYTYIYIYRSRRRSDLKYLDLKIYRFSQ